MDVYVESNFVLELVLRQEEREAARGMLALAEGGRIDLAIPAFSLMEPLTTIIDRNKHRAGLARRVNVELVQLRRSEGLSAEVDRAKAAPLLLLEIGTRQLDALEGVIRRLSANTRILPLDFPPLHLSFELQPEFDLEPGDAVVLASVLRDRELRVTEASCFVTQDKRISRLRA